VHVTKRLYTHEAAFKTNQYDPEINSTNNLTTLQQIIHCKSARHNTFFTGLSIPHGRTTPHPCDSYTAYVGTALAALINPPAMQLQVSPESQR
jgi:hypothetical protein